VIVLDTHALIWWVLEPAKLSSPARAAIDSSETVGFAAISCWEIGMLSQRGIDLAVEPALWLHNITEARKVSVLPLSIGVGVAAAELQNILRTRPTVSSPPPPSPTACRSSRRTSGFSAAVS